jgi:hypothetical protein
MKHERQRLAHVPDNDLHSGCGPNTPPTILSTCSAVSMCQPHPGPAIISPTISSSPPNHASITG